MTGEVVCWRTVLKRHLILICRHLLSERLRHILSEYLYELTNPGGPRVRAWTDVRELVCSCIIRLANGPRVSVVYL